MELVYLTYGDRSFEEIREVLNQTMYKDYTLSIYNDLEKSAIEVICVFEEILNAIMSVSNIEHNFPAWIGVNEISKSYVVGMSFTRGRIAAPSICEYKNGRLMNIAKL